MSPTRFPGKILFISGQIPMRNGALSHTGKVGGDLSVEDGYECARVCALNILAQAAAACGGDLDKVARCLKLGGFVNCGPDFNDHPKVINGASELMLRGLRRQWQACPFRGRRPFPAARFGGRGRGDIRTRLTVLRRTAKTLIL